MSLDRQIDRLDILTKDVAKSAEKRAAGLKGMRGGGRYGRKPDFSVISAPSTRPDSGAGVTFHFKHSFVSKKNSVSKGYRDQTSAPAHQRYIERAGAAERQIGEDGEPKEFSFGNLGDTKEERTDFWRKVEQIESRAGRVQCRMIIELPHELSPKGREKAAREFMAHLGDRGLPYWAVIHAPDEHNDRRNYHLHAVYYDRPCERLADGRWDFEVVTEGVWANGQKVKKRPLKQNKDGEARGKEWIRKLRADWAETVNDALEAEGHSKRHDPRPYRESGIRKMPTSHLGNKIALAESQGIDTKAGAENARREMRFRLSRPDSSFERISLAIDNAMAGINVAGRTAGSGNPTAAIRAAMRARAALSAGIKAAKSREANSLAVDVIGARLARRAGFLDAEYDRLTLSPPRWLGEENALSLASSLWDERRLIDDANADLTPFSANCRRAAKQHDLEALAHDASRQEAVAEMLASFPALRQILKPAELADLTLRLASETESDQAQESTALKVVAAETKASADGSPVKAEPKGQNPASERQTSTDEAAPPPIGRKGSGAPTTSMVDPSAPPAPTTAIEEKKANRKTEAAQLDGGKPQSDGGSITPKVEPVTHVEPGELAIAGSLSAKTPEEIKKLEAHLQTLPGWQLRYHALATRDAADFTDSQENATRHGAALRVIESEAAGRGLDLDTGRMRPELATDKARFERWRSEWLEIEAEQQRQRQI